ncbi:MULTISPECIES: lipoyl(octanoyl) transferase [Sulfurimonas]|uniref:lipoyl protein ligase domain-containing protein n=1 Tax=Sulfurimonas TaxID=202746 RepID=UPI0012654A90|nr:lipoyl(octanoyl) transferase [Sulfurimonas indica]
MILHKWGEVEYGKAREMMQNVHTKALQDGKNHLILCSHPNIFTVGSDRDEDFCVGVVQSDRGGSITCHSEGQNIFYFCFQVNNPVQFYKKVLNAFENFFIQHLSEVFYDKKRAGFYIQNRKVASLGFRYSKGVSLHGVALNVDVDLDFHAQVNPCNLEGVEPTSLRAEGVMLTQEEVNSKILHFLEKSFDDALQT